MRDRENLRAWRVRWLEYRKTLPDYAEWREKRRLKRAADYQKRKDYFKAQMRAYHIRNKEEQSKQNREWRAKHKEEIRVYCRQRYLADKERINAMNRLRRQTHPDEYRQRDRAYYLKTKDNKRREYKERNRDRIKQLARQRARRDAVGLSDGYVTSLLDRRFRGRGFGNIPRQLIECKRIEIQIKRKLKELCQNRKI